MLGVPVTDQLAERLLLYMAEMLEWNKSRNLSGLRDPETVIEKHLIDCLFLAQFLEGLMGSGNDDGSKGSDRVRLVDVGSGAGLPGVVVGLFLSERPVSITLIEATGKKVAFLRHVLPLVGLEEIEVIHGRAEDLANTVELRERFDFAFARALAEMRVLMELCLPFIRVGGVFVGMKGQAVDQEMTLCEKAMATLGGAFHRYVKYKLPYSAVERSLVVVSKTAVTPDGYPRRSGVPSKRPL